MDLHHIQIWTLGLANQSGSLVRLTLRHSWCPRQDLHLHFPDFESGASPLGYVGCANRIVVLVVGLAPTLDRV